MARQLPTTPAGDEGDRLRVSVTQKLDSAGTIVVGETVYLGDQGIQVVASIDGSWHEQHAYTLVDDDGRDIGGLYGRDDLGQNIVSLRAVDLPAAGDDVYLELVAQAEPSAAPAATATINLTAARGGEGTDTYLSLTRSDAASEIDAVATGPGGRVRVSPVLELVGADPTAGDLAQIYIKNGNLIVKYVDAGTTRYKYLDLTGTGTSWAHGLVEP